MRRKSKFIMILFVCMVAMLAGCGQCEKDIRGDSKGQD